MPIRGQARRGYRPDVAQPVYVDFQVQCLVEERSTEVFVENATGRGAQTFRYVACCARTVPRHPVAGCGPTAPRPSQSQIPERRTPGAQPLFERCEAGIVEICSSQIQAHASVGMCLLNSLPEQQVDSAQPVPVSIRRTVLVRES